MGRCLLACTCRRGRSGLCVVALPDGASIGACVGSACFAACINCRCLLRAQVGQQIGHLLRIADAPEAHVVSRNEIAGRFEEARQVLLGPDDVRVFHGCRVFIVSGGTGFATNHARQLGAEAAARRRPYLVARGALAKRRLARFGIAHEGGGRGGGLRDGGVRQQQTCAGKSKERA